MGSLVGHWMRLHDGCGWGMSIGVLLATGLFVACKPKAGSVAPGDPASAGDVSGDGDTDSVIDGPTSEEPQCAPQGSPWDGNPDGCMYEHSGCCYPDPASVCAAAGCTDDNCAIQESHPASAAC